MSNSTKDKQLKINNKIDNDIINRPPVITFMGHIDHGKTSIQDSIKKTNIVKKEDGKITQHIGASIVDYKNTNIIFIDTPGHEIFTTMRMRGAKVTDIVVLVIAADDGIKPQTIEAINHAKAANVPIIVAINKIDLQTANCDKVLIQMQENNLISEELGGDIGTIRLSAKTGKGLNELLERILLESEMLNLKVNRKNTAYGVVIESKINSDIGPVISIIVQDGLLKTGNFIICEEQYGKIKILIDESDNILKTVEPGFPIKLIGLSMLPVSGSKIEVVSSEKIAIKKIKLIQKQTKEYISLNSKMINSIEFAKNKLLNISNKNKIGLLNIILKADTKGTLEAIEESFKKLSTNRINLKIIHSMVGMINETDILLASTSKSIIIGFKTKINIKTMQLAKQYSVKVKLYSIIYNLIEEIKEILDKKIIPEKVENYCGSANILKIFNFSKNQKVSGCLITDGIVKFNMNSKIYRNDEIIFDGEIQTLRRYKDKTNEVKNGNECGISFKGFNKFKENDIIKFYDITYK